MHSGRTNITIFIIYTIIILIPNFSVGQTQGKLNLPKPKRLIDKVEVFAGPSLSFNYGNKFIENYKDENVTNKRLLKPGYSFGIGAYHPISSRFDLNVRLQYEQKGTRNELSTPSIPDDNRVITYDDYSYNYLTILAAPQLTLGEKRRMVMSIGMYYNKIREIRGFGKTYETNGTYKSEGHFKGRYFYDLRDDGTRQGFAWMPFLTSVKDNDIGVSLSIGYKVPLSEKHIILFQLQDNYGLQNINKNNPYGQEEKNHTISLIVGYIFQRSKKK